MSRLTLGLGVFVLGAAFGCSGIDIDDYSWRCSTSADCGDGWQCNQQASPAAKCERAYRDSNGVFDDRLVIGVSAVLGDTPPGLGVIGRQIREGIQAYFKRINDTGGIHGRQLELRIENDNYNPATTRENLEAFLGVEQGRRQVFLIANVLGTLNSLEGQALAAQEQVVFWAPGTGFTGLEPDPPDRYVFNFRARYSEEAEQLTKYLLDEYDPPTSPKNVAVFAQGNDDLGLQSSLDGFGQDTMTGTFRALRVTDEITSQSQIPFGTYQIRLDQTTPEELARSVVNVTRTMLEWLAGKRSGQVPIESRDGKIYAGIVVGTVFTQGAFFIQTLETQLARAKALARAAEPSGLPQIPPQYGTYTEEEIERLAKAVPRFVAPSGIGLNVASFLGETFGTYDPGDGGEERLHGVGMVIAQTVPLVSTEGTGVRRYREDLAAFDANASPAPFSLEAYLNMWMLGEALDKHGRDLTTESFIDETLEDFSTDRLGIGTSVGFNVGSHQATDKLWGVRLNEQLVPEPFGFLIQ
jgi:hypothetical protein